jgi:hypothetical protein
MTRHAADTRTLHGCGGTILIGAAGTDHEHDYCDRCGAFRYLGTSPESFPTCTDKAANTHAWDEGEERSPDATEEG